MKGFSSMLELLRLMWLRPHVEYLTAPSFDLFSFSVLHKHGISFHFYPNNSQIYGSVKNAYSVKHLLQWITKIKVWVSLNIFYLSDKQTNILLFWLGDDPRVHLDLDPLLFDWVLNKPRFKAGHWSETWSTDWNGAEVHRFSTQSTGES